MLRRLRARQALSTCPVFKTRRRQSTSCIAFFFQRQVHQGVGAGNTDLLQDPARPPGRRPGYQGASVRFAMTQSLRDVKSKRSVDL